MLMPTSKHPIYLTKYLKLIKFALLQPETGRTERHHIHPKSMGGLDIDNNFVRLSPRQHFIAHLLLWKAYRNRSMTRAFNMISLLNHKRIKSWQYAEFKEGMKTTDATKQKLSIALLGKKRPAFTEKTKHKMSIARLGMSFSDS